MKEDKRIPLYKRIWCKIRYWQSLRDVSDSELSACLQVCDRTLRSFIKFDAEIGSDCANITILLS